ncbi:uncharacterized protein LOC119985594 [Tripterygium wilfordii]|uniref:uncharacterized protein LOC119985594 n=1 Tax=Tripterygium wilfordii TaxID=458696 RepID=UPI0018F855BD|nr:uncharacterized protein LOC119985594 [Tripterygium wilfordii]
MSGGVGPTCNDISLPKEHEQDHKLQNDDKSIKTPTTQQHKAGFLSFRQLNALAVMIVLSASGMVSPEDIAFVLLSIIYVYFLSRVAFPSLQPERESSVFDFRNRVLRLYVLVSFIVGLLLPIGYIFEGIFEGDKEGIKAAAPHVFLLASQVFMEGLVFRGKFSLPIRACVPVCYNSVRMYAILEWLRNEFSKVEEEYGGSARRLYVGRALAIANLAFWSFNLFGFLLPVYLPKAFKRYYSDPKMRD